MEFSANGRIANELCITIRFVCNETVSVCSFASKYYAAPAAGRPRLPAEDAMAEGDGGVFEEDVSKADRTRQPIDARALIAACDASTSIATASVDEVHLSARGRFAPGGYYRSVAVLRL